MPDADDVQYREADGIAYLTLNRPAKLNALGPNSFRLLGEHITRFAESSAGVAILHGNGGNDLLFGSGGMRATLGLTQRIAKELLEHGTYESMTQGAMPYADVQQMLKRL